ncbi:MAG: enoyl-CoA hydratase-related protein [Chloroflexia bacterium]
MSYEYLLATTAERVCRITLNRPEVHNAFNRELIEELKAAFEELATRPVGDVRAVVLSGAGKSFCAGADVNWMRASLDYTQAENVADAMSMARMFDTINRCPVPVIGRIHGAALGGGVGLASVCDIVVASEETRFAFSEAKLGIAPAVISPYVLAKVGRSHARALFLTAERFGVERALRIGLIHIACPLDELDAEVDRIIKEIKSSAPGAIARAKALIATVPDLEPATAMQMTAETIASLRVGEEGQAGLRAFLDKHPAPWIED